MLLLHVLFTATPAAALLGARLTHCLELAERPFADGTLPRGLVADIDDIDDLFSKGPGPVARNIVRSSHRDFPGDIKHFEVV